MNSRARVRTVRVVLVVLFVLGFLMSAALPQAPPSTEQLHREIANLKETIAVQLAQVRKDQDDFQVSLTRFAQVFDQRMAALKELFQERDERLGQATAANRNAIDLALAAQKEALAEVRTALNAAIDNVRSDSSTTDKVINEKIAALTDQVTAMTARSSGYWDSWGLLAGVIMMVISAAGLFLTLRRRPDRPHP